MPRRNLHYLMFVMVVSFVCYLKADSVHRDHYRGMFDTFQEAMTKIRGRYLYEISERELFEGAMTGMVSKLDQYSAYHGETETRKFREDIDQEFGGVGIEVAWDAKTGSLAVLSPIVGSPAYEAGIMAGDRIVEINGNSTAEMTLNDAVSRLKGKPDEMVRITVERPGLEKPLVLNLKRAVINVNSVLGDVRRPDGSWEFTLASDPTIGYIRITQFGKKTIDELKVALEKCKQENIRGLILDLRNNPGGLLDAARDVCDLFVKEGVIVTIRDRNRNERERHEATGAAPYTDWPMAVIVNHHSASAAEIVSACLQDHARAIVVGQRTWGKGTVQSPFELEDGRSMLRLTIASYWRPSGRNIHRAETDKETDPWGVSPDAGYEVKLDDAQTAALESQRRSRDVVHRPGEAVSAAAKPQAAATPTASAPTATGKSTESSKPDAKPDADKTEQKPDAKPSGDEKSTTAPTENEAEKPKGPIIDEALQKAIEYIRQKSTTAKA